MKRTFACTLALATVFLASAPALADEVTMRIPYGDLDLTSADDVAELKTRVADAAEAACAASRPRIAPDFMSNNCENTMFRKGVAQVNSLRKEALAEQP